jgi:glycosyltransferase involved in cell wall biosynthesis
MRIAFLSTHAIQYQAPLFRALSKRSGVRVTALFCHSHGLKPSYDRGFGRVIRFDVPLLEGYESRILRNVAFKPAVAPTGLVNLEIAGILARNEFDAIVVHGYWYPTAVLSLLAPRGRTCLLLRGDSNLRGHRPLGRRALKQLWLRAVFRRVDHFLAIGTLNRQYYERYGVSTDRITVAPFSVDDAFFSERSRAARQDQVPARRHLKLPEREVLFLWVGKLISRKRPLDLLEAFAAAKVANRAGLVYVGDGDLLGETKARARALGVEDSVAFLGFRNQTDLPEIYGACDVLVMPSDFEPWGLSVNEAMASGAAAFVSDQVGAGPDLVPDPRCTFPVGDIRRLAQLIREATLDGEWRAAIRRAAFERIQAWGLEATADGVIEGVERALAARRPAAPSGGPRTSGVPCRS